MTSSLIPMGLPVAIALSIALIALPLTTQQMARLARFRLTNPLSTAGRPFLWSCKTMPFKRAPGRAGRVMRPLKATHLTIVEGVDISPAVHQCLNDVGDSRPTRQQKSSVASGCFILQTGIPPNQRTHQICSGKRLITSITGEVQACVTTWLRASCAAIQDYCWCDRHQSLGSLHRTPRI